MSRTSSRRDHHHLSLLHQNSSHIGTIANNIDISKYQQTMSSYKQFLQMFQNKIEKVCGKQNYRIYLNDRTNQKAYNSLISQKNTLLKQIQQSKDYRQSANRELIQQVMNLQKQKQQYVDRNSDVQSSIKNKNQQIKRKKCQLKQLQKEIKSYWVYNYDLTSFGGGSKSGVSYCEKSRDDSDKENSSVTGVSSFARNQNSVSISVTAPVSISTNNKSHIHLPCIISPKISNSSSVNNSNSQFQSITVFSKDLSLINSSPTRQKLIQNINKSCQQQAQNKLEYQREKLSLLKMFCLYIKKIQQDQKGITDRLRMEKVANELLQKIQIKENKLNQIEKLITK